MLKTGIPTPEPIGVVREPRGTGNPAKDLSKQIEIEYGTKSDGSTASFFKNSKVPTYQKMWASMIERKSNTETQDEGIARVISKLPLFEPGQQTVLLTVQGVVNMTCSCCVRRLYRLRLTVTSKKCSKTDILLNRHFLSRVLKYRSDNLYDSGPNVNYAFLMESSTLEYLTAQNCNLTKIGSNLDSKGKFRTIYKVGCVFTNCGRRLNTATGGIRTK